MNVLRAMLIWVLALSLPIEGMAATSMSHCKDMQKVVAGMTMQMQGMSPHDHAAMMASMSDDSSMAGMHHQAMQSDGAKKSDQASSLGCKCGCKCGGNCAVSCAGMMVSLPAVGIELDARKASTLTAVPRGQAHAAYRYDPLRPPSAVAL